MACKVGPGLIKVLVHACPFLTFLATKKRTTTYPILGYKPYISTK